jgi:hypothetical protein
MYLVQSELITAKNTWRQDGSTKPLLKALNMQWSGHPGLSDGAVPDALVRFINCRQKKIFGNIRLRIGELSNVSSDRLITIHYLVRESQEAELRATLEQWSIKAPSLAVRVNVAGPKAMMFCVDKTTECFFWHADQGRALLEETLPASAAAFRIAMRAMRPTATDIAGILNLDTPVIEDHYSRREKANEY